MSHSQIVPLSTEDHPHPDESVNLEKNTGTENDTKAGPEEPPTP
jgi:hypothetical protein